MMARYRRHSPWANTPQTDFNLEILKIRPVPAEKSDVRYVIESQYRHRPDLLAYDLYGSAKLWWVFIQRNMDILQDPVYDFEPGTAIFLPKKSNLEKFLGV